MLKTTEFIKKIGITEEKFIEWKEKSEKEGYQFERSDEYNEWDERLFKILKKTEEKGLLNEFSFARVVSKVDVEKYSVQFEEEKVIENYTEEEIRNRFKKSKKNFQQILNELKIIGYKFSFIPEKKTHIFQEEEVELLKKYIEETNKIKKEDRKEKEIIMQRWKMEKLKEEGGEFLKVSEKENNSFNEQLYAVFPDNERIKFKDIVNKKINVSYGGFQWLAEEDDLRLSTLVITFDVIYYVAEINRDFPYIVLPSDYKERVVNYQYKYESYWDRFDCSRSYSDYNYYWWKDKFSEETIKMWEQELLELAIGNDMINYFKDKYIIKAKEVKKDE